MATTAEEFQELLNAEQQVDIPRLCSAASHGIPDNVRPAVWSLLLGIHSNKSLQSYRSSPDHESIRQIRGEAGRYCKRRRFNTIMQAKLEQVVAFYLNNNQTVDYTPSLIALCGPFAYVFEQETEIYFGLTRMLSMIGIIQ